MTGLLAFTGFGLLLVSEFSDRLEADLGLNVFNLWIAASFAAVAVCVTALLGDTLFATIARRSGRRPNHASVTTLMMLAGALTTIGILIAHQSHPLALDGWIGLTGSVFLIVAALAHHLGPRRPRRRP